MGPFTVNQVPGKPQVFVLFDDDGNQQDLTSYTSIRAIMINPASAVTHPGSVRAIDPANPGQVILDWGSLTPFPVAGVYQIGLEFTGPGTVDDFSRMQQFEVEPIAGSSSMTMWVTPAEVAQITGKTVTDDQLVTASMIVDSVTNRTPAVSGSTRKRDVIWLKRAVAYQAVWQLEQPDIFSRSALANVAQDGVAATFTSKAAIYLAPLAIRALKNLTFMRTRSLRMQTPFVDRAGSSNNPLVDDALWNWEPMSMGANEYGFSTPWYQR